MAGAPRIDELPPSHPILVALAQAALFAAALAGLEWWVPAVTGLVGAVILAAVTIPEARASWRMRTAKRATGFTPALRQVQDFLDTERPEVIVHLSGPAEAAYQINTWIPALEHLDRRVLVIVRDLPLFEKMARTTVPVLALPAPGELLMLDFSAARVALYPSNTGNNIHLLRLPALMSAFIGHGDSDKSASNNPFSRAYDELWVAGEAGAERYRKSDLGITEDQFRFVGRPQVDAITTHPQIGEEERPTVLWAPTWEGVNPDQEYSSVRAIGADLVRALVADGGVRVVYKPHPFTGQRDARYRANHARIVAILDEAAARTGIDHRVVTGGDLTAWFNTATGLISDVSSVVSDFLASEKPYAVFDHEGLGTRAFREAYPSSAAATILGAGASGVDEFLDVVTGRTPDVLAEYRLRLATHLLGPAEHRSLDHFAASIEAFITRSEAERAQYRDD